ncbi:MAG TPA: hypothetical protein DCS93_36975 [Microscillaceae bacterium]|nr:hypothetical protein [Microscillaceae bacterium]
MKSPLEEHITQAIQAVLERFVDAWNQKEVEAFGELFTENAEFTDVVGQVALGKMAIKKQHEFPFTVVMKQAVLELKNLYARALKSDLVLVSGSWKVEGSLTPTGKLLPTRNGVIQFVLELIADQWKILLVHNSDNALPYDRQEGFL